MLIARAAKSPNSTAYGYYDEDSQSWQCLSWKQVIQYAHKIQVALQKETISQGDRVAIMLPNCPEWVIFDYAAIGLGLITVPLYTNDRAENIAYIIKDAEC